MLHVNQPGSYQDWASVTFAPFSKLRVLERRFLPHILESGMLPPHLKSKSCGTDYRIVGSATVPERVEGLET